MSKVYKNSSTSAEYTKIYEGLRGMDLSTVPERSSYGRFGYLENMYVDYESGGVGIESIPGFRKILLSGGKMNGLFAQRLGDGKEYVVVHAGNSLYRFKSSDRDALSSLNALSKNLSNTRSRAFSYGDELYIMDGSNITVLSADDTVRSLGGENEAYVPTVSENGEEGEDVNILTDECISRYYIDNIGETGYGSRGLTYEIINEYSKTCKVTGISDDFAGELYIPSYVFIDGKQYKVTAIGASAFKGNSKITALRTNSNLEVIEKYAFRGCTALKTVRFSDTVSELGHYSFYKCTALTDLYIGIGFTTFGVHSMDGCTALTDVYYAGTDDEFIELGRVDQMMGANIHSEVVDNSIILSIPVSKKISSISSLTLNGEPLDFLFDQGVPEIRIEVTDKTSMSAGEAVVHAKISRENGGAFFEATKDMSITPASAITGCTLGAIYDGRIFLSGNPSLPGFVFYSSKDKSGAINPKYFSASDFFIDGGNYSVCSLLSTDDGLMVFKSGDSGTGDIFYHKAGGDLNGYPVTNTLYNSQVSGDAFDFFGDIVFISKSGVCAIEKASGKMRVRCRSGSINKLLLRESLKDISLHEWRGYLLVAAGEHLYLGDSRATFKKGDSFEYEWYFINEVGFYSSDMNVFRYSSTAHAPLLVHENVDQPTDLMVYSMSVGNGVYRYFVRDPQTNLRYEVYGTEERTGGNFFAAMCFITLGDLLFFGVQSGVVFVFNNDKRGVAPPRIKAMSGFNNSEYKSLYGDIIHPDFYAFNDRAVRYVASTVADDCGLPNLEKSTVRGSLAVKFRCFPRSIACAYVTTDKGEMKKLARLSPGYTSFNDVDFSTFAMNTSPYVTLPIPEEERGWIDKRITICSNEFRSPIAIYSIAYRYKIKGKIKKK